MPAINDITGDAIKSKPPTDKFREEFERIFGKPADKERGHEPSKHANQVS